MLKRLVFLTILILTQSCGFIYRPHEDQKFVEKGELDLSDWSFEEKGNVWLKGEWYFFPKIIKPEDFKESMLENVGFMKIPGQRPDQFDEKAPWYGGYTVVSKLRFKDAKDVSFEVPAGWIQSNSYLISENGGVIALGSIKEINSYHKSFKPDGGQLSSSLESNGSYFLLRNITSPKDFPTIELRLGLARELYRTVQTENIERSILLGGYFLISLSTLAFFLLRRSEKLYLLASFVSLLMGLRYFASDFFLFKVTEANYMVMVFHNVFFGNSSLLSFLLVTAICYVIEKNFPYFFKVLIVFSAALCSFQTYLQFYDLKQANQTVVLPFWLFVGLLNLFTLYKVAQTVYKTRSWTYYLGIGAAAHLLGFIWDVFVLLSAVNLPYIMHYGNLVFCFCISLMIGRRFAITYEQNEALLKEVKEQEKARTLFFHNTSHELRTPLNGIIGYLDLVKAGRYGDLPNGAKHQISKALKLVDSLKFQVNTILDLAKSKKGELSAFYQDLSLAEISEECSNLAEGLKLKSADISFQSELSGERFVGDKEKLLTVLRNLLGNAFKFKDPQRANHISLSMSLNAEDELCIEVKDTGIGIPESQISKIFDEFAQVEADARRRYEGTGLGLAMVRDLVKVMDGKLEVESKEGEGSSFKIVIPSHEASSEPQEAVKTSSLDTEISSLDELEDKSFRPDITPFDESWKVLVIDDNETNCEVIKEMLAADGYSLEHALSGKIGLELMRSFKPHLVLLDMMMPEMSGEDVLAAIKADKELRHIPVILVTARASEEDRIYGLSLGANDYLPKPIVANELRLRVHHMVDRERIYKRMLESYERAQNAEEKSRSLEGEVKVVNQQLIQAERMVLLGQLVASVAHDMASPSQLISGASRELSDIGSDIEERFLALVGEPEDEQSQVIVNSFKKDFASTRKLLSEIDLANLRIVDIQKAIRNQSRNESDFSEVDLREITKESCIILGSKLKRWRLKIEGPESLIVEAHRSEIGQLLTNLISNACDALSSKSSGHELADIFVSISQGLDEKLGDCAIISIEDDGEGISEDKKAKLFTAFFTTKPVGQGTGLGLSICKKIAVANGGEIRISEAKHLSGACFEVRLPLKQKQALAS